METNTLTDFQDLPKSVEKFAEQLDLTPEQLNNLDWCNRDDWQPGGPCPNCGSTYHYQFFVETEFLTADDDGHYQFSAAGDRHDGLGYVCGDCDVELAIHPVLALLHA